MKYRKPNFEDRVRFNWGYWDGHSDRAREYHAEWYRHGAAKHGHFDAAYAEGYVRGLAECELERNSSEAAWAEYRAKKAA